MQALHHHHPPRVLGSLLTFLAAVGITLTVPHFVYQQLRSPEPLSRSGNQATNYSPASLPEIVRTPQPAATPPPSPGGLVIANVEKPTPEQPRLSSPSRFLGENDGGSYPQAGFAGLEVRVNSPDDAKAYHLLLKNARGNAVAQYTSTSRNNPQFVLDLNRFPPGDYTVLVGAGGAVFTSEANLQILLSRPLTIAPTDVRFDAARNPSQDGYSLVFEKSNAVVRNPTRQNNLDMVSFLAYNRQGVRLMEQPETYVSDGEYVFGPLLLQEMRIEVLLRRAHNGDWRHSLLSDVFHP